MDTTFVSPLPCVKPQGVSRNSRAVLPLYRNSVSTRRPRFRPYIAAQRVADPPGGSSVTSPSSIPGRRLTGKQVVVSGATGFIGRSLVRTLLAEGAARVVVLARDPSAARARFPSPTVHVLPYDAVAPGPLDPDVELAVQNAHALVNLAGEPIEKERWTSERKDELWNSRVVGSAKLARAAERTSFSGAFVTASAVGFYGTSESFVFDETADAGRDFLAKLASAWEGAVWRYTRNSNHVRTVVLRIGVVLGPDGGIIPKFATAFRAFLGGTVGGGNQWFSWVHRDDLIELIIQAILDPSYSGTYNCTAPTPVQLAKFCSEFGRVLRRPAWLPVPSVAVQAIMGSEAAQLVLAGQHVRPERMLEKGFKFRFSDVRDALEDILQPQDVTRSATLS